MKLTLKQLPYTLSVCKAPSGTSIPGQLLVEPFFSLTRTADELSLVIAEHLAPYDWRVENGWVALMVAGPLDFSLTGILSAIASPLAKSGIPIFAVSTYDTDYILVKKDRLDHAQKTLRLSGFTVLSGALT